MPCKGVVDRQRVGEEILAIARTYAHDVGDRLHTILAPGVPEGMDLPDFTQFQLHLAQILETRLTALLDADRARQTEMDDDPPVRWRRDDAVTALREQIVTLRQIVHGILGADHEPELLGLEPSEHQAVCERSFNDVWSSKRGREILFDPPTRPDGEKRIFSRRLLHEAP